MSDVHGDWKGRRMEDGRSAIRDHGGEATERDDGLHCPESLEEHDGGEQTTQTRVAADGRPRFTVSGACQAIVVRRSRPSLLFASSWSLLSLV